MIKNNIILYCYTDHFKNDTLSNCKCLFVLLHVGLLFGQPLPSY